MNKLFVLILLLLLSADVMAQRLSFRAQMLTVFLPYRVQMACSDYGALGLVAKTAMVIGAHEMRLKWTAGRRLLSITINSREYRC